MPITRDEVAHLARLSRLALSDEELAGKTVAFKLRLENGEPLARRTRVSLVPTTDAKGTGAGVGLSVEW